MPFVGFVVMYRREYSQPQIWNRGIIPVDMYIKFGQMNKMIPGIGLELINTYFNNNHAHYDNNKPFGWDIEDIKNLLNETNDPDKPMLTRTQLVMDTDEIAPIPGQCADIACFSITGDFLFSTDEAEDHMINRMMAYYMNLDKAVQRINNGNLIDTHRPGSYIGDESIGGESQDFDDSEISDWDDEDDWDEREDEICEDDYEDTLEENEVHYNDNW